MRKLVLIVASLSLLAPLPALARTRVQAGPGIAGRTAVVRASSAPDLFMEDFEGISILGASDISGLLPGLGWTVTGTSTSPFEAFFIKGLSGHSGSYYIYSGYDEANARNEWAITPAVFLEAGKNYRVALFANTPGYKNVVDEFCVMAGTSPDAAAMNSPVIDATGIRSFVTEEQEWREMAGRFTPTASGNYFFGVNHCSAREGNFVAFDDFRVSLIPESGGEVEFLHRPYYEFSMVPAGWSLSLPLTVEYRVRNVGDTPLHGATLSISAKAGGLLHSVEKGVGALDWDKTEEGSGKIDDAGTPDLSGSVECALSLHDASGAEIVAVADNSIVAPDRTTPWLARDNGQIAGCVSLSLFNDFKTNGRLGTRFPVTEKTEVDAVKFVLLGGYSTATSVIARIYKINSKGAINEYAASRREQLSTSADGYTEYTLTFPNPIDLSPGDYILSLDENPGEALGLAVSSNYTGRSLAFSLDGSAWSVLPGTPVLRLRNVVDSALPGVVASDTDITVTAGPTSITVEGLAAGEASLQVYTPSGMKVLDAVTAGGRVEHLLPSGVYVVVVGERSFRVLVR